MIHNIVRNVKQNELLRSILHITMIKVKQKLFNLPIVTRSKKL